MKQHGIKKNMKSFGNASQEGSSKNWLLGSNSSYHGYGYLFYACNEVVFMENIKVKNLINLGGLLLWNKPQIIMEKYLSELLSYSVKGRWLMTTFYEAWFVFMLFAKLSSMVIFHQMSRIIFHGFALVSNCMVMALQEWKHDELGS